MIVGEKGASAAALKPALNALEQWKAQDRVQALLGASVSTLRWREIIEKDKILLVVLNNDGSETDNLLARLMVGEMVNAFKERGLSYQNGKEMRPFHLFLDEFQSYAAVLESLAEVFVQELRKFGAKVHLINQSPSAVPRKMREVLLSNRTHLFIGRLGNPADAETIAKAMGGHQPSRHREEQQDPVSVESRDLLQMPKWHFISQVTQNGELSSAFQLKGIDANQTWAHLRSDQNITLQVADNTGLEPVDQRLEHYDTLPARIAHWLQHQKLLTIQQALKDHHRAITQPQRTVTPAPSSGSKGGRIPKQRVRVEQSSPAKTTQAQMFTAWANDCIINDPHAATPTAHLKVSYTHYCNTQGIAPLPDRAFQQLLTRRYGPSETARMSGKVARVRRGVKLRKT